MSSDKIKLPDFLKQLTSNKISHSKAIHVASKIYKTHHAPAALATLTDTSLKSFGIGDKDLRRLTLAAFKKANWNLTSVETETVGPTEVRAGAHLKVGDIGSVGSAAPPPTFGPGGSKPKKRKRSTVDDELPDRPPEELESAKYGNFDFKEALDEDLLKIKSAVINRAPVMTAWAMIVAERLGFEREEALSVASVYTEMNAISKGVSIGVYNRDKGKETLKSMEGAQPYVDLMGRRIPLYRSHISHDRSQWRALSSGTVVPPLDAYKYLTTSMKQTTPYIVGAMRLLAGSYEPEELNRKGFSLYCDFRPETEAGKSGWGKRGKVSCEVILKLRKERVDPKEEGGFGYFNEEVKPIPAIQHALKVEEDEEPRPKKPRIDDTGELDEDELFGS